MAGITLVVDPTLTINGDTVAFVPNSITYDEGFGEYKASVQTTGAGIVQQVFSQDVETALSTIKFSLKNTTDNIALARSWKANLNANQITMSYAGFTRAFNNASLVNQYEVPLGSETMLALEWRSDAAA